MPNSLACDAEKIFANPDSVVPWTGLLCVERMEVGHERGRVREAALQAAESPKVCAAACSGSRRFDDRALDIGAATLRYN